MAAGLRGWLRSDKVAGNSGGLAMGPVLHWSEVIPHEMR